MQRRAAAAYVAVFILLAAGSFGVIATAEQPHISLEQSEVDHEVAKGQSITLGGTEYTVTKIEKAGGGGGGHGGGGEATMRATLEYEATVEQSKELQNGAVIEYQGANWTVHIPNETDPSTFRLVENFTVDKPTVVQDGTTYVVLDGEGDNRTLMPKEDYMRQKYGEPRTMKFAEGDDWNETRTVANVTTARALITWETVETKSVTASEGSNVTLGGTTYLAHFPSKQKMQLTRDFQAYHEETEQIHHFQERKLGLWVVFDLSLLVGIILLALAYLPNKGD